MTILVTGGCGYIGSHIVLELLERGLDVIIVDNLCNSSLHPIHRVMKYTNKTADIYIQDLIDVHKLRHIFRRHKIDMVIHMAGLKAVGESYTNPLMYYNNNLRCTISLLEVMREFDVKNIIFSSSATVYGDPQFLPLTEEHPINPTNPYGQTKRMIEIILEDLYRADNTWNITILRYFNPVGAHPSGIIGDNPKKPNNLLPYVMNVLKLDMLHMTIFGADYDTKDGTGIRDYIHVQDLAFGHICAMNKTGLNIYNLGTGVGYSVMEVIEMVETVSDKKIPYKIGPRRKGDVATVYADPTKAERDLHWSTNHTLSSMCKDAVYFVRKRY